MRCKYCGAQISEDTIYCQKCGCPTEARVGKGKITQQASSQKRRKPQYQKTKHFATGRILIALLCLGIGITVFKVYHKEEPDEVESIPRASEIEAIQPTDSSTLPREYVQVLKSYSNALQNGYDMDQMQEAGLNRYLAEEKLSDVGYITKDLDNNGIEELIIGKIGEYYGDIGNLYDLYTISDNGLIRIIEGTPRDNFFLCDGARFSNVWSGTSNMGAQISFILICQVFGDLS